MSRPFESFEFLNRGWDIRLLEGRSLRSVFLFLLLDLFVLGILTSTMVYDVLRRHRFDWSGATLTAVLILNVLRYSPIIYRRLGR
jgi:hypothetical protein